MRPPKQNRAFTKESQYQITRERKVKRKENEI